MQNASDTNQLADFAYRSISRTSPTEAPPSRTLSLQVRIEQLAGGICDLLSKTSGLTYYPHLEAGQSAEKLKQAPDNMSMLGQVDVLNEQVVDLNQRVGRILEVLGGRI